MMHDALRSDVLAAMLAANAEEAKAAADGLKEHTDRFQKVLQENQQLNLPVAAKVAIDRVAPELAAYTKSAALIIGTAAVNKREAQRLMPAFDEAFTKLEGRMEEVSNIIERESTEAAASTSGAASTAKSATLWLCLLTALAVSLFARAIGQRVSRSFEQMLGALIPLANGDLRKEMTIDGNDEAAQLARAYNDCVRQLRELISSLQRTAERVHGSTNELARIQHSMAESAGVAASRAETATSSSEQVTENASVVSANADQMVAAIREISSSAQEAARVAAQAHTAATSATSTIGRLRASMSEINGVLNLITSVAEQTNLLALNAAIEAARAGDLGRGFTVVATEVKQLAQQTATAAEDITRKVEAIQADAEAAGVGVDEIGAVIDRVNTISATIAAAVEEQTAGTNEISRTISEVSMGSKTINASLSDLAQATRSTTREGEATAACTAELGELAGEMHTLASRFRL